MANIAFTTPAKLGRHETAEVELLLSPKETISELKRRLGDVWAQGALGVARVKFSNRMNAELQGQDFEITTIGESEKVVDPTEGTRWAWQITPKRTGTLHLHLTLNAYISVDGQSSPYEVATFSRTLAIRVTWDAVAGDFVKNNWQWLWTTVLAPVGLWAYRRKFKSAASQSDAATTH